MENEKELKEKIIEILKNKPVPLQALRLVYFLILKS